MTPEHIAFVRNWAKSGNEPKKWRDIPEWVLNHCTYGRAGIDVKLNPVSLALAILAEENARQEAVLENVRDDEMYARQHGKGELRHETLERVMREVGNISPNELEQRIVKTNKGLREENDKLRGALKQANEVAEKYWVDIESEWGPGEPEAEMLTMRANRKEFFG